MHQNDTKEGHQHSSIQIFSFVVLDFSYLVSSFNRHHLSFRVRGRASPRKTTQPFPISLCSVLTQTLRFNFELINAYTSDTTIIRIRKLYTYISPYFALRY